MREALISSRELGALAIFGGSPAFAEPVHVGGPNMGRRGRFLERVEDILDRRWFTNNGPYVREFEQRVREYCGVRECVATCNGTIALEILMRAVGLTDEVIVPAYTFVATAHALQWQEIKPVLCDVDPRTHTLDPACAEKLITPKTSGIVGVHLWGRPCDVEGLQAVADGHKLRLIFDAAHAFGCTHRGRPIGGFGQAEVFSFHATKVLNTFEGGAIVTNDSELAEKMRLMRNFGFRAKDDVIYLGSNGKMNEVSAAMGLTCFESLDDIVEMNRRNHERYRERLGGIAGLRVLPAPEGERFNYHYVVVEVDARQTGLSRDAIVRVLEHENVLARRYFHPGVHRMEPYRSLQPMAGLVLGVTNRLAETIMTLPTGQSVGTETIDRIAGILETAVANADAVRARLSDQAPPRT
jgi:dTDP-4-amino-4,6-dideoxygalactose transaminase